MEKEDKKTDFWKEQDAIVNSYVSDQNLIKKVNRKNDKQLTGHEVGGDISSVGDLQAGVYDMNESD